MKPETSPTVSVDHLNYTYPPVHKQKESRMALREISFSVPKGEIFCLLGPNGSGKSTLFRLLSTLMPVQIGTVKVLGNDLRFAVQTIREHIGVVFQHPSLDVKLTARENLMHQGHLYGLRGGLLNRRIDAALSTLGMLERAGDLVETLSGGMQRRIELAKSMLHQPDLLLLDEPSTGLDPGARRDFSRYLHELRRSFGVTILLTTHILDEAEECDTIAIFNHGSMVACGAPVDLKKEIGGDVISLTTKEPARLARNIVNLFGIEPQVLDGMLHIEREHGAEFIPQLVQAFPGTIETVTLSKPSLEDVFIRKTGHRFWQEGEQAMAEIGETA